MNIHSHVIQHPVRKCYRGGGDGQFLWTHTQFSRCKRLRHQFFIATFSFIGYLLGYLGDGIPACDVTECVLVCYSS